MRASLVLLVLAAFVACTAAKGVVGPVTITSLGHGSYAADSSGRKAVLAKNVSEYKRLWSELIADGDAPEVDLEGKTAVFLLAGQRTTGGWSIEPESVTMEDDGTAVIIARINAPLPRSVVTQALTSPWAIALVHTDDVKQVRWVGSQRQ